MPGPRVRWRHPDTRAAIAVLAVAAAAFAITFTFETVPQALMEGMGPERFPQLVIGMASALGLLLLWRSRTLPPEALPAIPAIVFATVGLLVATILVLPWLGVVPTMTGAMIALGYLWGERRLWLLAAVALPFAAGVHLLFVRTLGISLPVGPFGFILG
ncbi:tripartite tricarboxylate transporter TctB family protein [Elioraea sp.]|uniref:tripartite tricarboxylate transporter TctB family protein n=1 Tax=Elioraea sp. TaxID=2185103 RepID=UPI0025C6BB2A|nr:tripartite tricarboxylate transporter TctB family protein [Elioraea sp.]